MQENTKPRQIIDDLKKTTAFKSFKTFNDSHVGGFIPHFNMGPAPEESKDEEREEGMFEEPLVAQHRQ
jgi:hypothetical protein